MIPASASGLVTSDSRIHLMSPNAPAWGPFDRMVSNLVHEFAHCVSLRLNPRIANKPRWLWESVAIYGDTAGVLGIPLGDFQRDWFAFARQRYGF